MPTLNWIGKEKIITHHADVPFRVLEHRYGFNSKCPDSTMPSGTGNKIIHGDNLAALKSLLPEYEGRVDCIYIDPPYNTGNEKWRYNDNVNDPHILRWLGEVVGAEGEDFTRHDKWLCMMYPRLVLLRQLLSEKGAIFISIDDNEVSRLRTICDDIFGANCFKGDIIWHKTYSPRNDSKGIPTETDHILVYSKSSDWLPKRLERDEKMDESYKNPDNDVAPWTSSDAFAPSASSHQGMVYAVQHPFNGNLIYPTSGRCWSWGQEDLFNEMNLWCKYELRDLDDAEKRAEICGVPVETVRPGVKALMLKGSLEESREKAQQVLGTGPWPRFYFTKNGKGGIRRKTYLTAVDGKLITTFWDYTEVGHTDAATKELKAIFGGRSPFETPKPSSLIERIVQIATDEDSIVLDAFAGSGSTAHAVLTQNNKDKGIRKFVLIELMDYAETITAERVRRVMSGYPYNGKVKEEIYRKSLTSANLPKVPELLEAANSIREANAERFTKIAKPTVKDNAIVVVAEQNVDGMMPGLGGGFDFYELGENLFTDEDTLNESVGEVKIREYIYFSETRQYLSRPQSKDYPYLLDYNDGTGYFFYYKPSELTTLSPETLSIVPTKADHYVIYADVCTISKEQLAKLNITFKKIPRDITRF